MRKCGVFNFLGRGEKSGRGRSEEGEEGRRGTVGDEKILWIDFFFF